MSKNTTHHGRAVRFLLAGSVAALCAGTAEAQRPAPATTAQQPAPVTAAPPETQQAGPSDPQEGEVVVTGVRASLRSSINAKRAADNFSDIIKAQDIGKLPDNSVADSLSRITGVQIVRDVGASRETISGQPVNIRGLQSLSLLNGRTLLSGATGRDVDFRTLASQGFGELIISKSPTADRIEGGLGGTIELKTRNPLDFPKDLVSLTVEGVYRDFGKTLRPNVSGVFSHKFFDDRVGVLLSGSYQRREVRQDQFQLRDGWRVQNGYAGSGFDFDGNGAADLITPSDLRLGYGEDQQKRVGFDGTVTFKASDNLKLRVDGNYSTFDRYFNNGVFRVSGIAPGSLVAGTATTRDGTLLAGTFNNQLIQADGRLEIDVVKAYNYGFNAQWDQDRQHVTFDIGNAFGGTEGRQLVNRFQQFTPRQVRFDFTTGNSIPDIIVGPGVSVTDRSLFRNDLNFNELNDGQNREFSTRLDGKYDIDGFLTGISAGLRYTRTTYKSRGFAQNQQANNTANPINFIPGTNPPQRQSAAIPALDPLFRGFPVSALFPDASGNFPRTWLYGFYPGANLDSSGAYGQIYGLETAGQSENLNGRINIRETTFASYLRADFGGDLGSIPFRGNIGVRVIDTEERSIALQTRTVGGVTTSDFGTTKNKYNDVLPSATVVFDLTPKLLLRAAAGKVLRRPEPSLLHSPIIANGSSLTATSGNIDLLPTRAKQADVGLEWYFAKDGLLSVSGFYKDVKNFVQTVTQRGVDLGPGFVGFDGVSTVYTVTRPINSGAGKIKGFEINYQQAFTFLPGPLKNLGVVTNLTYNDAQDFLGQSKYTTNLIGYYDDGRFDVRVAYNYRTKYASNGDGSNGLQFLNIREIVASAGQLDLSTRYNVTNNLSLQFEGLNLTNTSLRRFTGEEYRLREYRLQGRSYAVSARLQF